MSTPKKTDTIDLGSDDWQEVDPTTGSARERTQERESKPSSAPSASGGAAALERPDGLPQDYELLADGLYWISPLGETKRLGSWLRVAGRFKEVSGRGWGKIIEIRDPDDELQRHTVLNGEISGQWPRVLSAPENLGFELSNAEGANGRLKTLLSSWVPTPKLLMVTRSGWAEGQESAFVLGDRVIGSSAVIVGQGTGLARDFRAHGTLSDWKEAVGRKAIGNPLLVLGISLAFFGPLQHLLGRDLGGGIHLVGSSSSGKSTVAECAVSVWGGPRLKRS